MVRHRFILVRLVRQVDRAPEPDTPPRAAGRPRVYSDRLIAKAVVIMLCRHVFTAHALLEFLDQDDALVRTLRPLLEEHGRFPSRRTWERRLSALPPEWPRRVGVLGCYLAAVLKPWGRRTHAVALDSTALRTSGGQWHKKHREAGVVPHTSIDCEAGWSKSGWHGWWYGWKLHLAVTAGKLWIPVAAELTAANTSDNIVAPKLLEHVPEASRYILGDTQYRDPKLTEASEAIGCELITPQAGPYPHTDAKVEFRRALHKQRSRSIEPFNAVFKAVFGWNAQVPVRGLRTTQLLVLGAVFLYQIVLLYQHEHGLPIGRGIKALLRAA